VNKRFEQFRARIVETLIGLSIPDTCAARDEPCILLSCHDVDRGLARGGAFFSPILAPIGEHYARRGKQIVNLTHPVTVYRSRRVLGGAVSVNRAFILGRWAERAEVIALGRTRAQARGRARRTAMYRAVLTKLRAERVFAIEPPHELCSAARELGIPVVEAMHGMNLHPDDRIITGRIERFEDRVLPSTYLAFDARTHATLTGLLQGRSMRAVAVPHPWHVEVHRERSQLRADSSEIDALVARYRAAVLVSLQWGYDRERASLSGIIPNGILHPALHDAIVSSPDDNLWLLRLHPIQIKRKRYGAHRAHVSALAQQRGNVETSLASSLPLPLLVSRTVGHITMSSGSAGEAALLGVPSLMLCPTLKPGGAHAGTFSELIETGMVTLGELDAGEILKWVAARAQRPKAAARRDWQKDTLELERRLDELIGDAG
jgi:hypothetical protein